MKSNELFSNLIGSLFWKYPIFQDYLLSKVLVLPYCTSLWATGHRHDRFPINSIQFKIMFFMMVYITFPVESCDVSSAFILYANLLCTSRLYGI